jgi:hypothetical protein
VLAALGVLVVGRDPAEEAEGAGEGEAGGKKNFVVMVLRSHSVITHIICLVQG